MMVRFSKDGKMSVPLVNFHKSKTKISRDKTGYVIDEAYCPNGCRILDPAFPINGFPGLRIKFRRADDEGEFVLSAVRGDFDKIILAGQLKDDVKDDLYCPHCDAMFEKLTNCKCQDGADMVVIGLTTNLDFNNAISFCNVTGCENSAFVKSGQVLRNIRLVSPL